MTIALLQNSHLEEKYWGYAWLLATHIKNRTPHSGNIDFRTPFEVLFGYRPDLTHLRVFGCIAYAHIDVSVRKKLHPKSIECIFLGYDEGRRSYVLQPLSGRFTIIYRKDDIFHEDRTIKDVEVSNSASISEKNSIWGNIIEDAPPVNNHAKSETMLRRSLRLNPPEMIQLSEIESHINLPRPTGILEYESSIEQHQEPSSSESEENQSGELVDKEESDEQAAVNPIQLEESDIPNMLFPSDDSDSDEGEDSMGAEQSVRRNTRESHKPEIFTYDTLGNPRVNQVAMAIAAQPHLASVVELQHNEWIPKNAKQALSCPESEGYAEVLGSEIESLVENEVFRVVPRPKNKHIIECKLIFSKKYDQFGNLERYKCRIVALGNHQIPGVEYHDTFAPVRDKASVRLFLSLSVAFGHITTQFDAKNAFFYGVLDEEIYIELPPTFRDDLKETHVCRLLKSIYGLKQAMNEWT